MAKKNIYTGTIDKYTDWGGDVNTGYAPVAGESVQQFIKDTFDRKIGIFHYDVSKNQYLAFADEFTKEEYLDDSSKTNLILGHFDAPFNYTAEIHLKTPIYNAIFVGDIGNYIEFDFDIKNKESVSTGENVIVKYTFTRGATKQEVSEIRHSGSSVRFNIDKYLREGTNTIMIGITGQTTLAATTIAITYQVVNLTLSDELNISKYYDISNESQQVEIPFTVSGNGSDTKIIEWYIDGVPLKFVKDEDEVGNGVTTRTKYITLSKDLKQGTHSLQIRAYSVINEERFYTDTLYRDLLIYDGTSNDVIIGIATTIPREYGIIQPDKEVSIYEMIQYIPYNLRFATYSPSNAANTEVVVKLDGNILNTINSKNDIENEVIIVSKTSGNKTLELISGDISKNIVVSVKNTSMNIHEIGGATIDFPSTGKIEGNTWTDGTYIGTFEGFNWNSTSGWVNGRLEMNAGSSLHINYAPLSNNPTNSGKTIEIEWSTKNVKNDNAIICDLRGNNGVGILITATKVSMISANGTVIETEYKSEENVRIGFVINKSSEITNNRLSFIYTNGIVSRAEQWVSTDNYNSNKEIVFTATNDVEISLKSIKVYDTALSSDNMLNNFILYRDNIYEMMEIYDRNDVYEEGTTMFSPDKMANRLPVMIVTGDIPKLESTSVTSTEIVVDIEYTNLQDPSRSFKMVGAAMRPQGTSSMNYPKKNFRIYTQERDETILYDANGNEVKDKLYSFKKGAQPVNCWCLKADYAESSGTHNTGIARLWNDALYNARVTTNLGTDHPHNVKNATVLRTRAQNIAAQNGYEYDVRTTIDGFPILLFYRPSANEDVIFLGKYNFNNDKSTESVFGFTDIPNFENSRMQCWEVLHNGKELALFTTTEGFDTKWSDAFEIRYAKNEDTSIADLKRFAGWMSTVTQEEFVDEKWDHMDVYKMAAYWVYLMRYAAADQFVKNAMFTSEDGEHFYYILYDNDTINGLINSGRLKIRPTDDRQTKDEKGDYVFAGHDSRLWERLEADEEFIKIVSAVDNALYTAGISYKDTIKIFDNEQADKWVERVYNQDAMYKYISPYIASGTNNLFMLQGKRDLHRRWWLAKRFAIYDAKYVSGQYKSLAIVVKCANGSQNMEFTVTAGYPLDYGYGINDDPVDFGVSLKIGESHTFSIADDDNKVYVGDPIRIYGAPNIAKLDLSSMIDRIEEMDITNVYNEVQDTKLTTLILGGKDKENVVVSDISGLKSASLLEYLDIQGMKNMGSLDLTSQLYFKTLKANNTNINSVTFAKGAPVERLELPASMRTLSFKQLPYLTGDNVVVEGNMANVSTIDIKGCPNITNNFNFVEKWLTNHSITKDKELTLIMDNINWTDMPMLILYRIANLGHIELKGKVILSSIKESTIKTFITLFGENVFDNNSDFYIDGPYSVFVIGKTQFTEGESETYKVLVFGDELIEAKTSVTSGSGCSFDEETNTLSTIETGSTRDIVLTTVVRTKNNDPQTINTTITVNKAIYVTTGKINGPLVMDSSEETYIFENTTEGVNAEYYIEWELIGLDGYAELKSLDQNSCIVKKVQEVETIATGELKCTVKKMDGSITYTDTLHIKILNESIAEIDPGICEALQAAGLCESKTYITKGEAETIGSYDLQPDTSSSSSIFYPYKDSIISFNGFKWFTNVREIRDKTFSGCGVESITIPNSVTTIGNSAFENSSLKSITIPNSVTSIGERAFLGSDFESVLIPDNVISIGERAFYTCQSLKSVTIGSGVTSIGDGAFSGCRNLRQFIGKFADSSGTTLVINNKMIAFAPYEKTSYTIPKTITSIGNEVFYNCSNLKNIYISDSVTSIGIHAFYGCAQLTNITIPDSVTTIGKGAFRHCYNLTSINISNKITEISDSVFYDCDDLTSITIPDSVTLIGNYAFYDCSSLTSVTIPDSVTSIGDCAFQSCTSLTSVNIPDSITTIGSSAFKSCRNLKTITCKALTAPNVPYNPFGDVTSNYTGYNTRGQNVLLVPRNSSGYETGYWEDPLCQEDKCGFTLSKTL